MHCSGNQNEAAASRRYSALGHLSRGFIKNDEVQSQSTKDSTVDHGVTVIFTWFDFIAPSFGSSEMAPRQLNHVFSRLA
jgi:hypothetical protein